MKNSFYTILVGTFILMGCSNDAAEVNSDITNQDSIIETPTTDNIIPTEVETFVVPEEVNSLTSDKDYQEFHATGELKIEGNYDDNQERHGLWVSYYETGIKWSESNYTHGNKHGHSITFYPTGKVRYLGEYANDKQVGHWTFYDEEGNIASEEDY
ncbi:MAG: antitoxin component YwqK of YwqJK toxin-antitoxin module [Crocinitomix sp.]|jgi:antitoxin component YwqK of YwqJK toxin-antitoxin module